jgi:probable rRNA maturation factor
MYNSVIQKGKLSLFLSDTGRIENRSQSQKLKEKLSAAILITESLLKGKLSKEIKLTKKTEFSLTMCGNTKIKSLNRNYRQKDKVTDVLSFPMFESLRNKNCDPSVEMLETVNLGDIVISKDVAKKQAKEFGLSYEQEVIHLFIHGLLHILGFDHEVSSKEEKIMEELEQLLVKKIYKILGLKGTIERHGRIN